MIREEFFPTIIYGKDVQLNNQELAQHIINWSQKDQGVKKTNVKGWHSQTDMHTRSEYKLLVDELFKMQFEIYKEEHIDRNPKLGNMWANINPPGAYNNPHVHPNALFSGVYYIKGSIKSGKLKLYDPRPGVQLYMPVKTKTKIPKHLWRDVNIDPVPGRIIMFPASVWHSVDPNESNDIRISVSFNFIQEGLQ